MVSRDRDYLSPGGSAAHRALLRYLRHAFCGLVAGSIHLCAGAGTGLDQYWHLAHDHLISQEATHHFCLCTWTDRAAAWSRSAALGAYHEAVEEGAGAGCPEQRVGTLYL